MISTGDRQMDQHLKQTAQPVRANTNERDLQARRPYEAPQVMVMDETEVLKVFQITSAGISWWG
jgi:hypothetical protein